MHGDGEEPPKGTGEPPSHLPGASGPLTRAAPCPPDPPGAVPQALQQNQHFCRQVSDWASPPVPAEGEGPHLGLATKLASQQGQPSRHWGLGSVKRATVLNWDFVFKIA